eukprot:s202_g9.t1
MVCIYIDDMLGGGSTNSKVYMAKEAELKQAFNFREWQMSANLEYCGASLEKTASGGWALHHYPFMKRIKPIALARGRQADDPLSPSEVSQLRALKLNSDVKLQYEWLGDVADLRLVCQFGAAFGVRRDSSSQAGRITMLIHKDAFSGRECPYHVLDWKSSKLPRVTRSSLGAEAQSAGQAADSVEFVCRYWEYLKDPNTSLAEILERPTSLEPTLVTDAKALYAASVKDLALV